MNLWRILGLAIVLVVTLTACPGGNPGRNGNPTTATVSFSNPNNVGSFDTTSFTGTSGAVSGMNNSETATIITISTGSGATTRAFSALIIPKVTAPTTCNLSSASKCLVTLLQSGVVLMPQSGTITISAVQGSSFTFTADAVLTVGAGGTVNLSTGGTINNYQTP